jgi:hypothetical protein
MSDLTTADITTGTELVYQGPSVDYTNDRDYRPAVRGTVVDVVEETKHLVSDTVEQTMVVIETEDNGEKRVNIDNLVGDTDFRVGVIADSDDVDADDQDNNDDDVSPEIVTDGGVETTRSTPVSDDDIEAAIERHDDPEHPDALTVDEVRALLERLQQQIERTWGRWMDLIERGDIHVTEDTGDVLLLAVRDAPYGEILEESAEPLPVAYDEIVASVVQTAVHNAAERLGERSWANDYALVVAKPKIADAGETYVIALINGLLRRGLSPGQAWAYYGVEVCGHSRNKWASRCGYSDHSAVSEPLRKAERKLDA